MSETPEALRLDRVREEFTRLDLNALRLLVEVLEGRLQAVMERLPGLLESDETRPMHKAKGQIDELRSLLRAAREAEAGVVERLRS